MKCYDWFKNGMASIPFTKNFGKKERIEYLDKIFSFDDFNSKVSNYTISLKKSEDKCFEQIRNICGFVSHDEQDELDLMFSPRSSKPNLVAFYRHFENGYVKNQSTHLSLRQRERVIKILKKEIKL